MSVRFALALAYSCLLARAALIQPSLEALAWKFNGTDFWSPVHLDHAVYHVQSPSGALPSALNRRGLPSGGYLPCTVVNLNSSVTTEVLEEALASYAIDDVWSAEQFMDCLYVQYTGSEGKASVDPSFTEFVQKHGVTTAFASPEFDLAGLSMPNETSVLSLSSPCDLSNGPYVVTLPSCEGGGVSFTPVYALHPDTYEAFMEGSMPDPSIAGSHQQLQVSLPGSRLPNIIVPTTLGSTDPGAGPLAGLRFAVKDIFHIKGLKTSGGSRAYYQLYDYQNYTTETVALTLAAGAELIGKVKTITFALGTPENGQEIDFADPWNARGDGYQTTGGSSSGSGAAATAYPWVDFAVGSDTGGSVRFPASYGGLYGYKPSHGVFNLTGILVAIAAQDTPGFMARDPRVFTRVGRAWTAAKDLPAAPAALPTKMLRYLDQPTAVTQPAAAALIEGFFADVAAALALETTGINMTQSFLDANVSQTDPPQDMAAWMPSVYTDQNDVELWDAIGHDMVAAYGRVPGQEAAWPPVDPPVNASWANGRNATTRARYPEAQAKRRAFAAFYNTAVLPASRDTCGEHLFAHTYHAPPTLVKVQGKPVGPRQPLGFSDGVYANYAGVPEVVVPVGQVQYWSPFTRRSEWQPVTVALGMAKGCDNALFELVDRLVEAGLLKGTLPGKVAYPVDS